jgi:hypothetical protein
MRITTIATIALLLVLGFSPPLQAATEEPTQPTGDILPSGQINFCVDSSGRKMFTNQPCPNGHQAHTQTVQPNVLSTEGLRSWAKRSPQRPNYEAMQHERDMRDSLRHAERQEQQQRCNNAKLDYSFESTWKSPSARPAIKKRAMEKECAGL